jgi:hypothetical protein
MAVQQIIVTLFAKGQPNLRKIVERKLRQLPQIITD